MRTTLLVIAACLMLGAVAWWWQAGSSKGWTKTSVQVWKFDEITEISYPESQDRFVPGVDFLLAAGLGSALLCGVAWFARKQGGRTMPGRH